MVVSLLLHVYNGPNPSNVLLSLGYISISAASTRSNGFSIPRLACPFKSLVGLHTPGRSTLFEALNGSTADDRSTQGKYED